MQNVAFFDYFAEDAAILFVFELESGAKSEDLLENLGTKCIPEDSESSSGNEVEATEMQDNEQSSEKAFLRSRTAQRTNTSNNVCTT